LQCLDDGGLRLLYLSLYHLNLSKRGCYA
jgi:hypothetical protein